MSQNWFEEDLFVSALKTEPSDSLSSSSYQVIIQKILHFHLTIFYNWGFCTVINEKGLNLKIMNTLIK